MTRIGNESFLSAPLPRGAWSAYASIWRLRGYECMPPLYAVHDGGEMPGLFTNGAIVLGVEGLDHVALSMWRKFGRPVAHWRRAPDGMLRSFAHVKLAAMRCVLAHEVRHFEQCSGVTRMMSDQEREADADRFAGYVAAGLDWDCALHELVAYEAGCLGPLCIHPSPIERVQLHRAGVRDWHREQERKRARAVARLRAQFGAFGRRPVFEFA